MYGYNFTQRTREVLDDARREAHRLCHEYVGTEHLLLALLADDRGVSAAVLAHLGVEPGTLRAMIEDTVQSGRAARPASHDLPYTVRGKRALELAMAEARALHHGYIGTEHLLLGLVAEVSGIDAQALASLGVTLDRTRAETTRLLGAGGPAPPA